MAKVTNLSRAVEIVRTEVEKRTAKKEIIEKLVIELAVKRANAFVYFTKASKLLDIRITDGMRKAPKKKNPVTEISSEKAAKKIAEIDQVIANLKASGASVASPFAGLAA